MNRYKHTHKNKDNSGEISLFPEKAKFKCLLAYRTLESARKQWNDLLEINQSLYYYYYENPEVCTHLRTGKSDPLKSVTTKRGEEMKQMCLSVSGDKNQ